MENGTASQAKGYNLRNKKHPSDKLLEVHVGGEAGSPDTQGLGPVPCC